MTSVENLTKSYPTAIGRVRALRGVSFEVAAGCLFGVYGPVGSGKSTLVRLIGLRDRPDAGVVRIQGVDTAPLHGRRLRKVRRTLGTVDPTSVLRPERTAAGNIATPLEQRGVEGPQRRTTVAELLDLIGLSRAGHLLPGELNEGQRRRVALARALAAGPSALLVDDPTAGLEPDQSEGVLSTLDRARAELSVTVLVATPDADVVRRICDHVAVLADGRLIETGSILRLLSNPASHTARTLLPPAQRIDPLDPPLGGYDRVADVLLIGFATAGLLPQAADRFGVELTTIHGSRSRIGETPIARFRLGLRGVRCDAALDWIEEHGGMAGVIEHRPAPQQTAISRPTRSSRVSVPVPRRSAGCSFRVNPHVGVGAHDVRKPASVTGS